MTDRIWQGCSGAAAQKGLDSSLVFPGQSFAAGPAAQDPQAQGAAPVW